MTQPVEVLLNINTWETFRYQPITFYNGYTLCKYEVLMSLRCLCVWVCVYQIPISCSLWVIVVGAKMSVLNTGVRLGEGWVGGSRLTLRCAEKLTHFYHGLKAPVCHTFDWSMFDYPIALKFRFWVLELFDMEVLWLSPLHQASHIWWMYWFEHQIEPKLMFTGLLSYRTDFCLFDITGRNLKVNHRLTCV